MPKQAPKPHQERLALHRETEALRKIVERKRKTLFWGQEHIVAPKLLSDVLGDGQQLMTLTPINTRPNYYVCRIDSSWSLSNWDKHPMPPGQWLEDLYQALEAEFGDGQDEWGQDREDTRWPEARLDGGTSWHGMDWPDLGKARRLVKPKKALAVAQ